MGIVALSVALNDNDEEDENYDIDNESYLKKVEPIKLLGIGASSLLVGASFDYFANSLLSTSPSVKTYHHKYEPEKKINSYHSKTNSALIDSFINRTWIVQTNKNQKPYFKILKWDLIQNSVEIKILHLQEKHEAIGESIIKLHSDGSYLYSYKSKFGDHSNGKATLNDDKINARGDLQLKDGTEFKIEIVIDLVSDNLMRCISKFQKDNEWSEEKTTYYQLSKIAN
ncbi:MAG: hypothetical protein D8M58_21065 [Calditrichaeota bacterium]|nr:MAG: hypothetical protein DWQ03_16780 [Calditrichota bacterium]MBL1207903.1 hypothetical protein [Calditrichota bacterium]NOG47738.1 hypothetical protein [Calditrichota bacterium]